MRSIVPYEGGKNIGSNKRGKAMNLVWVTENENQVPTEETMEEIKAMLKEQLDELVRAAKNKANLSMFVEIDSWFLQILIIDGNMETIIITPLSQDEWLDKINERSKGDPKDNFWSK